jgi:hypothetical protein
MIQRIDTMLMGTLTGLCQGLILFIWSPDQPPPTSEEDRLVVYACCVKEPALEQNMKIVIATALWPRDTTTPPATITFGDSALVWLDLQFQNVQSTEQHWPSLQALLCPVKNRQDDQEPIRRNNLNWTVPKEVPVVLPSGVTTTVSLEQIPIERTDAEVLPGYVTYNCLSLNKGAILARVLVLNRYINKSTPLMLRGTTGLKTEGSLYLALQEWSTRIVPPL